MLSSFFPQYFCLFPPFPLQNNLMVLGQLQL